MERCVGAGTVIFMSLLLQNMAEGANQTGFGLYPVQAGRTLVGVGSSFSTGISVHAMFSKFPKTFDLGLKFPLISCRFTSCGPITCDNYSCSFSLASSL